MKIKCCSLECMADLIKQQHKRIILFGAGVIGTVTAPAVLQEYGLIDKIECYIDNDHSLCGNYKLIYGKKYLSGMLIYLTISWQTNLL